VKKIITSITFFITSLYSQFDLYPVTDFFGGGIGYSPMYINIEDFPATDLLKDLGLDPKKFDSPFVVHGGEGFAHMTENGGLEATQCRSSSIAQSPTFVYCRC